MKYRREIGGDGTRLPISSIASLISERDSKKVKNVAKWR